MTTLAMNFSSPTRSPRGEGRETSLPPMLKRIAVSAAALLATLLLGRMALHRFDAPVRELAITGGLRHVQANEVREAAAPLLDAKLFELDLSALRVAIERLPWVAHARIDRQWPARLSVRITEREPFARWGETDALSTESIVFAPGADALSPTLPLLAGAAGREQEVMAMYGQLADHLSETPLALTGLAQDARGEWTGATQTGLKLRFGRGNPLEQLPRLKSTVLPALSARLDSVQSIDLRYANGFAVAWRAAEAAKSDPNQPLPDAALADTAAPGVTP